MIDFLTNYYFIFIIISVILIFALIGYFISGEKKEVDEPFKLDNENGLSLDNLQFDSSKSLQDMVLENAHKGSNDNMSRNNGTV